MDWLSWVIVAACAAWFIYDRFINRPTYTIPNCETTYEQQVPTSYQGCYQARYLLTRNEWYAFKKLQELADSRGLEVCPKVRLLDIIEPRSGRNDYMALMGKISSKHIDFLICDRNMHIKAIIELDDNSHNRPNRMERDLFVDQILTDVGYKVIHTKGIADNILDNL